MKMDTFFKEYETFSTGTRDSASACINNTLLDNPGYKVHQVTPITLSFMGGEEKPGVLVEFRREVP